MSVWAIVVAAGIGTRFGGPKQFESLGDRRVLDWSLDAARGACGGTVLVVPPDRADRHEPGADLVTAGGDTRSASVRAGLAVVPPSAEVIVVHDAARPLASSYLWKAVVAAVHAGASAVVPVIPVRDTLREVGGGTVDRARFVAVQTPQAFQADALRRAHDGAPEATDDAALVEAMGTSVLTVPGEPENVKVTTQTDLAMMRVFCR